VEKPAVPRQNPVKKRRKVEKPTDPRQKPVKWRRAAKTSYYSAEIPAE